MIKAQGQAKRAKKSSTYDVTYKKPATPKQKFFFECRSRLAASVDASTRYVTCTGAEIFPRKTTCKAFFFENARIYSGA